jgi:hypothetical protein
MLSGPNCPPLFLPLMKSLKPSSRAALVKAVSDGSARESTMSPKRSEDVPCGSRAAVWQNARMLEHCLSKQTHCRRDYTPLECHFRTLSTLAEPITPVPRRRDQRRRSPRRASPEWMSDTFHSIPWPIYIRHAHRAEADCRDTQAVFPSLRVFMSVRGSCYRS